MKSIVYIIEKKSIFSFLPHRLNSFHYRVISSKTPYEILTQECVYKYEKVNKSKKVDQNCNFWIFGNFSKVAFFCFCHFYAKKLPHFFHFGIFCRFFVDRKLHHLTNSLKSFASNNISRIFTFTFKCQKTKTNRLKI